MYDDGTIQNTYVKMPVVNNIITAAIFAPFVAVLSTISLSTLQRSVDWVASIAKNPQKGYLRELRPYAKQLDTIIERLLSGNKFTPTATNILLMGVIILLIAFLLEGAEKPKRVQVVEKKKSE